MNDPVILNSEDQEITDEDTEYLLKIAAAGGVLGGFLALLALAWLRAGGEE